MRKNYSAAFKVRVILDVFKEERTINQIALEHELHPVQISKWKAQVLEGLPYLFGGDYSGRSAEKAAHEKEVHELYAEIGKLTAQLSWLKKKSGINTL
jgi:transposase-like protein